MELPPIFILWIYRLAYVFVKKVWLGADSARVSDHGIDSNWGTRNMARATAQGRV